LTVARVIEAVFFFQPLNVLVRRRMQEAAEFASDGWALRAIRKPLDLARCLARVAEWAGAPERLAAPAMAERRGSVLVRRVARLTSGLPHDGVPHAAVRVAVPGALVALMVLMPRTVVGSADRSRTVTGPAARMLIIRREDLTDVKPGGGVRAGPRPQGAGGTGRMGAFRVAAGRMDATSAPRLTLTQVP
jgi:hypothetical protein